MSTDQNRFLNAALKAFREAGEDIASEGYYRLLAILFTGGVAVALGPIGFTIPVATLVYYGTKTLHRFSKELAKSQGTGGGYSVSTRSGIISLESIGHSNLGRSPLLLPAHYKLPVASLLSPSPALSAEFPVLPSLQRIDAQSVYAPLVRTGIFSQTSLSRFGVVLPSEMPSRPDSLSAKEMHLLLTLGGVPDPDALRFDGFYRQETKPFTGGQGAHPRPECLRFYKTGRYQHCTVDEGEDTASIARYIRDQTITDGPYQRVGNHFTLKIDYGPNPILEYTVFVYGNELILQDHFCSDPLFELEPKKFRFFPTFDPTEDE